MALVIEDGSVVTGANSYASAAGLSSYMSDRGLFLGGLNGSPEQILLTAMSYIEAQNYLGTKGTKAQPLQFPRAGLYIDGFLVDEDEIPAELVFAQYETAIAIDAGNNPLANLERATKSEKVGDIAVTYADDAKDSIELRALDTYLSKLVDGGRSNTVALLRA